MDLHELISDLTREVNAHAADADYKNKDLDRDWAALQEFLQAIVDEIHYLRGRFERGEWSDQGRNFPDAVMDWNDYRTGRRYGDQATEAAYTQDHMRSCNMIGRSVYHDIADERSAQDVKWGEQNHSPPVWLTILGEEYGEACEQTLSMVFYPSNLEAASNYRRELIQIAAVAIAAIESLDRQAVRLADG